MKSISAIFILVLLMASNLAFAQQGSNDLLVISPAGEIVIIEYGGEDVPAPIVLMNGKVLHTAEVNCVPDPFHPQCASLETALSSAGFGPGETPLAIFIYGSEVHLQSNFEVGTNPVQTTGDSVGRHQPGIILVEPGQQVTLLTIRPGDYPPPLVIIDDRAVNRPDTSPGEGSPSTSILLRGDQVLSPGKVDCDIAVDHPQCQSLALLLGDSRDEEYGLPGVVIISRGDGATLLTGVYPGDYPPPLIVIDYCIVNPPQLPGCQ